jgi:hypothetical protein
MTTKLMEEMYDGVLKHMKAADIEDTPVNRFWVLVAMRDGLKSEDTTSLSISESIDRSFAMMSLDFEIGHLSRHITIPTDED